MSTVSSRPALSGRRLGLAAIVVTGGFAIALAGCANSAVNRFEKTGSLPDDYRTNHPITIEEQIATLDLPVSVDTAHITLAEKSNVDFFARSFLESGSAVIAVVAPSGSPNQLAAARVAVEVEQALRNAGVSPRAISYRVYKADKSERVAPVRIAFNRVAAVTAPCGPWTDQTASNAQNKHYDAFGCATQQNLAASVANPLDLLYPRGMTPADATRRATVLEKYGKGETFTSDTSTESGGTVATGVGQ